VLGGRAMEIVYDESQLAEFMRKAIDVSPERPVLVDRFLEDAIEVDVDMVGDGRDFVIGGILEHIEEAGVHSGDAAMVLPPHTLGDEVLDEIRRATCRMAKDLGVVGLMNVQFAVKGETLYVLEVNPRASRTVPFISKAVGLPLAKIAAKVLAGKTLRELGLSREPVVPYLCVKESVFPFNRFHGTDILLGPEMRSTGEVMGIDVDLGRAYLKSQSAAGQNLPSEGAVFISVSNRDKRDVASVARRFDAMGFRILATSGTARVLRNEGIRAELVRKVQEGRPNILDMMKNGSVNLVINTPSGKVPRQHEVHIRALATNLGIPVVTTISGARASAGAVEAMRRGGLGVKSLQAHYAR